MRQQEIHNFLTTFFQTTDCDIIASDASYLQVQLTVEMDKELMNRPFYWHYLEKTGGAPKPMALTLITDQAKAPKDLKGEAVHFGSPRLHQIFQVTKKLSSFIRMYEKSRHTNKQQPLHPWLCLNAKISYQCDRKKDVMLSLGLHLINGAVINNFHDAVTTFELTPKIPDYSFTLSPLIKPKSGIIRLKQLIANMIANENDEWAKAAKRRQQQDLKLLDHFYEGIEELPEAYEIERQAIIDQYEPKIVVTIINGGLFYLTPERLAQMIS